MFNDLIVVPRSTLQYRVTQKYYKVIGVIGNLKIVFYEELINPQREENRIRNNFIIGKFP